MRVCTARIAPDNELPGTPHADRLHGPDEQLIFTTGCSSHVQ